MTPYVAFLRGVNVGGKWLKMADVKKRLTSSGLDDVQTYIQSGNIFFNSKDKNEKTVQDKITKEMTKLMGSEVHAAVFPRVELFIMQKANPFTKINSKPEDKRSIIFLAKEPKHPNVPLFSLHRDIEVFYYKNRMAFAVSRKRNGKYDYPTALIESKWSVPATTRFWHTFENMMNEMG